MAVISSASPVIIAGASLGLTLELGDKDELDELDGLVLAEGEILELTELEGDKLAEGL